MPLARTTRNDAPVGRAAGPVVPGAAAEAAVGERLFRVDSGHPLGQPSTAAVLDAADVPAGADQGSRAEPTADGPWLERLDAANELLQTMRDIDGMSAERGEVEASGSREDRWLRLHAADLIGQLQRWSDDLDSREAQLNSRAALLDHRERQLRLQRQNAEADLAVLKQSIDSEYETLRAQARRLAFE